MKPFYIFVTVLLTLCIGIEFSKIRQHEISKSLLIQAQEIRINASRVCAPINPLTIYADFTSVKDGNWSDPATWGGTVPTENDVVKIATNVYLDVDSLPRRQNIIVTGKFRITKGLIKFLGINENDFVGGGEEPLATDKGIWVINGQLEWIGESKTSWVFANDGIVNTKQLAITATNWKAGDEIMITPTEKGKSNFDIRTLNSPTTVTNNTTSHQKINNKWTPEVANLTRAIRIEGTPNGRSHVFIRSDKPQTIKYVSFRWLGPRKDIDNDGAAEIVLGRYGLHFHHCNFGSKGSIVEGCVMRDIGNHAYVTHGSHNIKIRTSLAHHVFESPFWWDAGFEHSSHHISWEKDLASDIMYVPRAKKIETTDADNTISSRGFEFNHGDGDEIIDCVVVGTQGDGHDGGGFKWEAVENSHLEGVWKAENLLAHNCNTGSISWQNTVMNHVVRNLNTYHCGEGIFQGAYANSYEFIGGEDFGNPTVIHAGSVNSSRIRLTNRKMDSVAIISSPLAGAAPILLRNCDIRTLHDWVGTFVHSVDIVNSSVGSVYNHSSLAGEVVRVQPIIGQAFKIQGGITTPIENFAPSVWGTGKGLTGSYYTGTNFQNLAFRRIDSYIGFSEWGNGVHYGIGSSFSVRWTGSIEPYTTGPATFTLGVGDNPDGQTCKLYINGQLVLNKNGSATYTMQQGIRYTIQVDYVQTKQRKGGINLYWNNSLINGFTNGGEYVPMCQLYPDASLPLPITVPNSIVPNRDKKLYVQTYTDASNILINADKKYQYRIYTSDGKQIRMGKINSGNNQLPIPFVKGIYILELIDDYGKPERFKIFN